MLVHLIGAALYLAVLCVACSGLTRGRGTPPAAIPIPVPAGRHAKAWPRGCDPGATIAFMNAETPFLEWDEWTKPLRRIR